MSEIRIQREDFDPGAEMAALQDSSSGAGAIATFVGIVRSDGGVTSMTLDYYSGMCESEIAVHALEARKRWPILGLRIVHRAGKLVPGDRIVFVGVTSTHRHAAFQAAEFLMDYLKTRAPFWKLERRGTEETWVAARTEDDESVKRWQA
jgi:molybdopterin synthase catalytic subunit